MRMQLSRRLLLWFSLIAVPLVVTGFAYRSRLTIGVQPDGSILVPNGQTLTPAGSHIEVSDRPLGTLAGLFPRSTLMKFSCCSI